MSGRIDERRRSSGTKDKLFNAFRRVSLVRRPSSEQNDLPQASTASNRNSPTGGQNGSFTGTPPMLGHIAKKPSLDSVASVKSPSSYASSLVAPVHKLNSSSPASELPQTWDEWNYAYQHGFIDFDDPPPPPSDLRASEYATSTGQFRAPFPANEIRRQRAVDAINVFNRPSLGATMPWRQSPKTSSSGEVAASPPPHSYPTAKADSAPIYSRSSEATSRDTHRQEGPMHPALEKLAQEAKRRFGVDATTVSLMDRNEQVFLADDTCTFLEKADTIPRELTCCSHAMLKASTGTKDPLVILDFAKDWRFAENGFGSYKKGFYAAAPIMLPAPMGDEAEEYPAGIFCLLGEKPKQGFSEKDRVDLQEMADRASSEIKQYAAEVRQEKRVELAKRRQEWKKSKLVRKVAAGQQLESVAEIDTPPLTPELGALDLTDTTEDELFAKADEELGAPRRPSLAESAGSDASVSDLRATSAPPIFNQKDRSRGGVLAAPPKELADSIQSVVDLSTQLVAESIEMDFSYVVAVDLAAARAGAHYAGETDAKKSPIRFVSTYGMPIPAPLFSIESHLEPLVSAQSSLLFTRDDLSSGDDEFSTGLLVKIAVQDDIGFVLGCFSEDARRVLNSEDLLFIRSFGRDLQKYMPQLV
ncbi:GAF domain-containing protein [Rhodotorula paludigena]|uniref:GAF domain-containing protein n=1 Tax=Rhodotorula paludigena TaxID=86838 RepID=UPI00317CD9DC